MIEVNTPAYWRATIALVLGSFMIFANIWVTQPLLPMLVNEFSITPLQSATSLTITTFTLGLSLLVYGVLSDAIGRRVLMIATLTGVLVTTASISFVTDFQWLVWLRALQGVFLAGLPAMAVAYMGDEFTPHALAAAVGIYISGNTLGGIGGRLIGGFVGGEFGWQSAFQAMALISLVCLIAFILLLPSSRGFSPRPLQPRVIASQLRAHVTHPILLLCFLIGGLNFFIFINLYSYVTFILEAEPHSLSTHALGLLFLTYLSGTVGSAFSGKWAQRFGAPTVMMLGTCILIMGTLTTLIGSLAAIILGLLINSFGFFICHSSASGFVSRTAKQAKASASSLYLVFYYLGASTGGLYLDPFWQAMGWHGVVIGAVLVSSFVVFLTYQLQRKVSLERQLAVI